MWIGIRHPQVAPLRRVTVAIPGGLGVALGSLSESEVLASPAGLAPSTSAPIAGPSPRSA
jgi:hypothetical protein